ncbi:MAG TPA: cupredoxin family copper-binding protein [Ramlibacter sp.]|nr:cupredoxin family copper-binding protein [Ramlibacter sp.]
MIAARLMLPAVALAITSALAASAPHEVRISGMKFAPAQLSVQRGDTVTWKNADLVPHTATAKGKFDSGNIGPGQSYSRKMEQPGEFDYICTYHPGMQGKLTVK